MSSIQTSSQIQSGRPSSAPSSVAKLVRSATFANTEKSPGASDTNVSHVHGKIRTIMKKRKRKKLSDRHQEEDLMKELLINQQLEYLGRHTHFSIDEVRSLYDMFKAMTKKTRVPGEMDRTLFREVFQRQFGMTNDIMLDQMYYFFDADHEGSISITEWVKNLSILLRGNLDEHINSRC
ncbi:unnamed protein product [Allacma fusca]|uniref:EF-hand domain-containing protein n=1 Tax=Allacma fusca TaxID=39272 RepID=A0A8J2J6F5_9HEXA|nr:unnamed protein product [Allacma fusca]